ncbi:MAG: hypothetical protein HC906_09235 [Bacteroidales bacterium]|nr:hypothetical protein [Bacteroidales bacterium]
MISSVRKIGYLILLVIILPVIILSVFEIGNLRQNERVIWEIYKNQLDAILFSINQFSEEFISGAANKIDHSDSNQLIGILNELPASKALIQFDDTLGLVNVVSHENVEKEFIQKAKTKLVENDTLINRLKNYLSGGYRKLEPFEPENENLQCILFYFQ